MTVEPRAKVRDLRELAAEVSALKAQGKTVVHAHGVYDLLHPGHIRHLESAKQMGDVLVVTVTEDRHVNKGPHRPAFPQELRAESVAALAVVDYVAINHGPLSVDAIHLLRPDVYVKGAEYRATEQDATGGIVREMDAIRAVGGRILFTDEIVFSSSHLLNRHLPTFSREVADYLHAFRLAHPLDEVRRHLDALRPLRVLIVGEAILDEYVYCEALGKSGKEPMIAMRRLSSETYAGGALAMCNHLAEFCDQVALVTYVGAADRREAFCRAELHASVRAAFLRKASAPTIVKRRYVDAYHGTKLLEVYELNDEALDADCEAGLVTALEGALDHVDVVIAADYGHGLISKPVADLLASRARFLVVNTQANAANVGFHTIDKYARADYVCLHERELRLARRSRSGDLRALTADLAERMGCRALMVTRGSNGTLFYAPDQGFTETPALASKVVDRVGAGDAVLALTSLCVARGVPADVVGFVANMVGAEAVSSVGNSRPIERVRFLRSIDSVLK